MVKQKARNTNYTFFSHRAGEWGKFNLLREKHNGYIIRHAKNYQARLQEASRQNIVLELPSSSVARALFQDLLARADYARARTSGGIKNRSGGGVGGEALETSPYSVDRANDHDDSRDDEWAHRSRAAWSTVMYQVGLEM